MHYFILLLSAINFFQANRAELTNNQQLYLFFSILDKNVENFMVIGLAIAAIAFVLGLVSLVVLKDNQACGCMGSSTLFMIAIALAVGSLLNLVLTHGMLASVDPSLGIVNPVLLAICAVIFLPSAAG